MAKFVSLTQQQKEIDNFINNLSDIDEDDYDDSYSTDEGLKFVLLVISCLFPQYFALFWIKTSFDSVRRAIST